jgi:ABC-type amino acid transport substrate-binding protein
MMMASFSFAKTDTTLTFSKVRNVQDQTVSEEILKEAYKKLRISFETKGMPAKRSIKEADEGKVDGEVSRVFQIGELYPELIRIPTPINYIEPSVFSKNLNFTVTDCDALRDYTVGIVRGAKFAQLCTEKMDYVFVTNQLSQALNLLNRNRVDIVIATRGNGFHTQKKEGLESIHILSPALTKMPVYHYLNPKHKDLAVKIAEVLSSMQKNGELETLRESILKKLNSE